MIEGRVNIPDWPLFDGRGPEIARQLGPDIRTDLAATALTGVMTVLSSPWPSGIRDRTPHLETLLNIEEGPHRSRVNYDGTPYGAWIEGTGSRNRPRPGFPGYHAFARSRRVTVAAIPATAQRNLRLAVARLAGG